VVVQGVHETHIDQSTRPDHSSGLDEELANGSSKTETETLSRQGEQGVEAPAELASVEVVELLQSYDGVDEVTGTTSESGVGHGDNDNVFLDVERTRVEVGLESEDGKLLVREESCPPNTDGVGDKLYNVGTDGNVGVTQQEKGVERGAYGGHDETDSPSSDGVCGHIFIVVSDDSADLRIWRIFSQITKHLCLSFQVVSTSNSINHLDGFI